MVWTATVPVQKPWLKQNQYGKGASSTMQEAISKVAALLGKSNGNIMEAFKSFKGSGGFSKGNSGKGWSFGGNNYNRGRSNGRPLAPGVTIEKETRFLGRVKMYNKWRGFGMVELNKKGIMPNDTAFVHWTSITTEDRYPFLTEGMDVELNIHTYRGFDGKTYARAKNVTMTTGAPVSIQDDLDAQNKAFIGGQHLRYLGHLKFYDAKRGFGFIIMEDGYSLPEPVPKELRVDASEVNAGGRKAVNMKEMQVEFGLWKNEKGIIKAYNMTLPEGIPCTREALEKREVLQGRWFTGIVQMHRWKQGWGFIKPDEKPPLPPKVIAKLNEVRRARKFDDDHNLLYFRSTDVQQGSWLRKDGKVKFLVYTDDMGAGACEIISTEPRP